MMTPENMKKVKVAFLMHMTDSLRLSGCDIEGEHNLFVGFFLSSSSVVRELVKPEDKPEVKQALISLLKNHESLTDEVLRKVGEIVGDARTHLPQNLDESDTRITVTMPWEEFKLTTSAKVGGQVNRIPEEDGNYLYRVVLKITLEDQPGEMSTGRGFRDLFSSAAYLRPGATKDKFLREVTGDYNASDSLKGDIAEHPRVMKLIDSLWNAFQEMSGTRHALVKDYFDESIAIKIDRALSTL